MAGPVVIEQPVKQLHDFLTYRTPESRQSSLLLSLSASSSALTLPRNPAKFSSSSFSLDRYPPLRGNKSPLAGEALLPPPGDDCLFPGLDDPHTAGRCEPFPGSEYPSSLPACAMVRAVLSAGPSGAPDWVGFQDLYITARGSIDHCECLTFVRPLRRDGFPIRGTKRDDTSSPCYAQILGVRRSAVFRWKPGIWLTATSSSLSGASGGSGVGQTTGLFTIVLGGRAAQRTGDGGGHQSTTGCRCHVVESTNIITVCYGNEQDVIFDDGIGPRSIVVFESRGRCLGGGTTRSSGGIIYVGDGVVAPSEQSKCS